MNIPFSSLPHISGSIIGTEIIPAVQISGSSNVNVNVTPNDLLGFVGSVHSPATLIYASTFYISSATPTLGRIAMTDAMTITPTTPTPIDGAKVELWINVSEGAQNLTFDESIVVPTESTFTSPKVLTSDKTYIVLLKYDGVTNGGQWELASLVGGY